MKKLSKKEIACFTLFFISLMLVTAEPFGIVNVIALVVILAIVGLIVKKQEDDKKEDRRNRCRLDSDQVKPVRND